MMSSLSIDILLLTESVTLLALELGSTSNMLIGTGTTSTTGVAYYSLSIGEKSYLDFYLG